MKCARHVARIEDITREFKILIRNLTGTGHLEDLNVHEG